MSLYRSIFGLVFVPLFFSLAQAQTVDPANPQSVVSALQDLGYRAELSADSEGDPQISSAIEGSMFRITFYGCDANVNCSAMNFASGFDLSTPLSWEVVNEWNRTKLVGRVYVDEENDPFIDFFIDAQGGLPRDVFESVMSRWGVAVASFKKEIDF